VFADKLSEYIDKFTVRSSVYYSGKSFDGSAIVINKRDVIILSYKGYLNRNSLAKAFIS
jgi:hypothetical protein